MGDRNGGHRHHPGGGLHSSGGIKFSGAGGVGANEGQSAADTCGEGNRGESGNTQLVAAFVVNGLVTHVGVGERHPPGRDTAQQNC